MRRTIFLGVVCLICVFLGVAATHFREQGVTLVCECAAAERGEQGDTLSNGGRN